MTSTSPDQGKPGLISVLHLDSIRNRILVLALLATLIPAVGTAVIAYVQNRQALTENLNGELASRGTQSAREVDLWIKERAYDVRVFTGSFEVSENVERIPLGGADGAAAQARLTEYLTGVYGRFTDYAELIVTDADGEPLASTNDAPGEVPLEDEWLVRLGRGETVLDDPYWRGAGSGVSATLAAPIETADGRFVGVLAATLEFEAVEGLLESLTPGEAGSVDVLTGDGRLIASSAGDAAAFQLAEVLAEDALGQLRDADGGSVEYLDRNGTPVVGTLTPVPGLAWSVLAQIPASEAFAQIAQLRNSAILLISFLLAVVGAVAYFLGIVIVQPLVRLTEGAGAVASGDLSVDLPTTGRGEVGYLTGVFNEMVSRLRSSREELDKRNQELERLSVTDLLTGLNNRRFLLDAFDKEVKRSDRHERPFCVLMIDVDRFKQYNDTHGHLAGDKVLKSMGTVIMDATRDLDVSARYGGEEFIVLLPECDLENGVLAAERIRTRLAQEEFEYGPVTISVGVAEFPTHGETPAAVIAEADTALYEAKDKGRDQVRGAGAKPDTVTKTKAIKRSAAAKRKRGTSARKKAATTKAATPKKKGAAAAKKKGG